MPIRNTAVRQLSAARPSPEDSACLVSTRGSLSEWRRRVWISAALLLTLGIGLFILLKSSKNLSPTPIAPQKTKQVEAKLILPPRPDIEGAGIATDELVEYCKVRDEVFDLVERLVDDYPKDPYALNVLANTHQRFRNEQVAVDLWQDCLELDSKFVPAYVSLGKLAAIKGEYGEAEEWLSKAGDLDQRSVDVMVQLADVLLKQGKSKEVIKRLTSVLRNDPDLVAAKKLLARAYEQQRDYDSALRYFNELIVADPNVVESQVGIATVLQRLGRTDEAKACLEIAARLRAESDGKGMDLEPAEAAELRNRMTVANAYRNVGLVYAQHGRDDKAEAYWRKSLRVNGQEVETRELLVDLYMAQGREADAYQVGKELAEMLPESGELWGSLGVLAVKLQRFDDADELLRHAIRLTPAKASYYAVLAQVQMPADRNPKESVQLASQAVQLQPTAGHYYILGTAHWNNGENEAATKALRKAIELEPNNPEFQQALAYLQQEM